jgi:hypothetical protein
MGAVTTTMREQARDLDLTTHHEAGHGVIACALGLKFTALHATPDDGYMAGLISESHDVEPFDAALILHAGQAAEMRRCAERGMSKAATAAAVGAAVEHDLDILRRVVPDPGLRRHAEDNAAALVDLYWPAICDVAAQLRLHGTLHYGQVRPLVPGGCLTLASHDMRDSGVFGR